MPRYKDKELSALEISRLTEPGTYFVGKPPGLALRIKKSKAKGAGEAITKSWIIRYAIGGKQSGYTEQGKRREKGLGRYHEEPSKGVTLAQARKLAQAVRDDLDKGIDPLQAKEEAATARAIAAASSKTFQQVAEAYIQAKRHEWKNEKHRKQWESTLATYVYPKIGAFPVREIGTAHILHVLEEHWISKTETMSRVRARIEKILDLATTDELRSGDNPARWLGHLKNRLAAPNKVAKVEHHAALPYVELGAFMVKLRAMSGTGAKALEFAILTAARSGEVRGAVWSEFDLAGKVWIIPAVRMKAEKEHWVPLSDEALKLLAALPGDREDSSLVFPSSKGTVLSDMTLSAVLKRMEVAVTAHGFRSTFRDWAGETTAYPREVIEHALAHQLKDKAEAAYARGTLFDKRRHLMNDWAKFCGKVQTGATAGVTPLHRVAAA